MIWDPFEEIAHMHEEIDRMSSRIFRGHNLLGYGKGKDIEVWEHGSRAPVVDVRETETGVIAAIELPGADKKDIELNVTDNSIEVKAEKKHEVEKEEKGRYRYEKRMSQFYRRIPLPAKVQSDKAKSSYKNGILRIEAPKVKQIMHKKKRIEIE